MSFDSKKPEEFSNTILSETDEQQRDLASRKNIDELIDQSSIHIEGDASGKDLLIQDSFLSWLALDTFRHNELWPYELAIVKATDNGSSYETQFRYIMPIPPNAINMDVPSAGNIGVTLKGIYEEHNSAPLRNITISGTTGIQPLSGSNKSSTNVNNNPDSTSDILNSIFSNTLSAFGQLTDTANRISSLTGSSPSNNQSALQYDDEDFLKNTGYAWFQKLSRFLDYYLAIKKTEQGKNYRLVLLMHKDQQYYSCFLRGYNYQKLAGTLEYKYRLNLVAWRRHAKDPTRFGSLEPGPGDSEPAPDINAVARAIQTIRESRRAISDSINVLRGIRQDVSDTFIKPMKEASLLLKTVVDLGITASDLGPSIIQDMERGIRDFIGDLESLDNQFQPKVISEMAKANVIPSPSEEGGVNRSAFGQDRVRNESFAERENKNNKPSASPTTNVFADPDAFAGLLDEIDIDSINMSEDLSRAIEEEIERVENLDATHFKQKRNEMENLISSIVDSFGAGNATYRRIKDLPDPTESFKKITISDALLLVSLEDAIQSIDTVINLLQNNESDSEQDYFDFFADLALSNNVPFVRSNSKFYVPFPHGSSLDQLAARYLGDSSRWIEIAALNGLKEPYVDEEGFEKQFISSAAGDTLTLSDRDSLFIGQKIIITSDTQVPTIRKIISIDKLSEAQTLIRVDGDTNLNKYTLEDNGRIKAFLPDTVNSNNYIAIPSINPVNIEGKLYTNPKPEDNPRLINMAKVDFKLTSSGDLAMTSGGDLLLSFGLANLVQASNIKLRTPQNSIVSDPSFGNPIQVGTSIAEVNIKEEYKRLEALFTSDPRFTRVPSLRIKTKGPASSIDILLGIANTGIFLPVTAEVPR